MAKKLNLGKHYAKRFIYSNFGYFTQTSAPDTLTKLIKGSKNSDFSLVSSKNLSKILTPCSWGPGPNNFNQEDLNTSHL